MADIEIDSDYDNVNERARMEAHTLNELSPLNPDRIVGFKAFYRNSENQYVLVMEKAICSVDDVLKYRKRFTEHEAKVVIHAVLEALVTCHKKYIVHRDIKPANLLLFTNDLNSCKLGDFGICSEDNGYNSVGGIKGTAGYFAPEILKKQQYGRSVDIWSTGVTAYQLLFGSLPFPATNKPTNMFSAKNKLIFPSRDISNEAQDFIKALLIDEPSERLTAVQALSHPWIAPLRNAQKSSAVYAPEEPIIPEPVPGFPGWLKLKRGKEPAYFFHELTRQTQWNHPEEDPLPVYTETVIRNTAPAAMSHQHGVAYVDPGRSQTVRPHRSSAGALDLPARGFSNPEVYHEVQRVPQTQQSTTGSSRPSHYVPQQDNDDDDDDEEPLIRKTKSQRRREMDAARASSPPAPSKPTRKTVGFANESTEITTPPLVGRTPAAYVRGGPSTGIASEPVLSPVNSPITSPIQKQAPMNHISTPPTTVPAVSPRLYIPADAPPPSPARQNSVRLQPTPAPTVTKTSSNSSLLSLFRSKPTNVVQRTPSIASGTSATINDITWTRASWDHRVQQWHNDPIRMAVCVIVWLAIPLMGGWIRIAGIGFLLSQFLM
ncbi:hypothetical protein HDU99_010999 [Rhizoclosmatium hyalinum]|nr:hypothetical protein HDU99_010999 [Rhizoclosmatium hyalinum]